MLNKIINKFKRACKSNRRLLGKILVDGGFISDQNLEAALARQKETNELLGEALVSLGALSPMDLKVVLSVQRDLSSLENSVKAAAGIRSILGELLLQAKHITSGQLDAALVEQSKSGDRLGEILIRRGLLSDNELNALLAFQQNQSGELPVLDRFRLGSILVAAGQITKQQVKDILARQKISKKKIGELLIEAGYLKPNQLKHGLELQQKLVTAAIIATLSMGNLLGAQGAEAESPGGSASTKIQVSVKVLEQTSIKILNQAQEFVVTDADIMKGYVYIPAASQIAVKSNNPNGYFLTFEVMSDLNNVFKSISVDIDGREVQLSANGGLIHQPFIYGDMTTDLNYRFELSKDAKPGTYNWPLMVSV
jgi:hypothetical protein